MFIQNRAEKFCPVLLYVSRKKNNCQIRFRQDVLPRCFGTESSRWLFGIVFGMKWFRPFRISLFCCSCSVNRISRLFDVFFCLHSFHIFYAPPISHCVQSPRLRPESLCTRGKRGLFQIVLSLKIYFYIDIVGGVSLCLKCILCKLYKCVKTYKYLIESHKASKPIIILCQNIKQTIIIRIYN